MSGGQMSKALLAGFGRLRTNLINVIESRMSQLQQDREVRI